MGKSGKVDRVKLADRVFRSAGGRRALEGLLHPVILRQVLAWKKRLERWDRPPVLAVVEVPLLHERKWASHFDGVLCVKTSERLRRRRLRARGWDDAEIRLRERLQWSGLRKAQVSDWVVVNDGGRGLLHKRLQVWRHVVMTGRMV